MSGAAVFSPCGTWRYRLERDIALDGIVVAFFGVNPSTAGATAEDQTTRKWAGFAKVLGARKYIAGNPFALCATDVTALAGAADAVGPENADHLEQIIRDADVLVPCWGARAKVPDKLWIQVGMLRERLWRSGKPVRCLGFTKCGQPRHPLTLGYATPFVEWRDW